MSKPKIIFEMANNHMGDINHGLLMVNEFVKLQKTLKIALILFSSFSLEIFQHLYIHISKIEWILNM